MTTRKSGSSEGLALVAAMIGGYTVFQAVQAARELDRNNGLDWGQLPAAERIARTVVAGHQAYIGALTSADKLLTTRKPNFAAKALRESDAARAVKSLRDVAERVARDRA